MGRREDEEEERTAARDFCMARLAACRGALAIATDGLDEALALFIDPEGDAKGKTRSELLEGIDDAIGLAARAVQAAQALFEEIDPKEGEPDPDEDDGDDDDDNDKDDD